MKIKILDVYEQKGTLNVQVETPYGIDKFGLSPHQKYLDPETDKPRWMSEVRELLDIKYGQIENRQRKQLTDAVDLLDVEMELDQLAPKKQKNKSISQTIINDQPK